MLVEKDESLQVLSRYREPEDEGGSFKYHEFLYAAAGKDGWSLKASSLGSNDDGELGENLYRLLNDTKGRAFLIADLNRGLAVQVLDGGEWRTLDGGGSLPVAALEALGQEGQLGAAWFGADDVLRVLYGSWLYEIEGDEIARATDTAMPCTAANACTFDPTGDEQGAAAVYNADAGEYTLRSLQCSAGACTWTDVPGKGLGPLGINAEPIFFHTAGGTSTLIRLVEDANGDLHAVLASTPERDTTVVPKGVYYFGAAPRPSGGFVVASHSYSSELSLVVADDEHRLTTFVLGSYEPGSQPVAVSVVKGSSGAERVHIVPDRGSRIYASWIHGIQNLRLISCRWPWFETRSIAITSTVGTDHKGLDRPRTVCASYTPDLSRRPRRRRFGRGDRARTFRRGEIRARRATRRQARSNRTRRWGCHS